MTPTLTKDDWIEIASALSIRLDELLKQARQAYTRDDKGFYQSWITHLTQILVTIGDDGDAMWPKEDA